MKAAFTLIEVLLTFAVTAVLIVLLIPVTSQMSSYSARVKSTSNLRQIGIAARLYANDHDQQLPGHPPSQGPSATPPDQWPALFCAYLSPVDPRVFLDATDAVTSALPLAQVISNSMNNTAFVYNGFDDLGTDNQPPATVYLSRIAHPAIVVLLSQKSAGSTNFFVDVLFEPIADLLGLLSPAAYDGGSLYLFVDGSVRFIKQSEYSNSLWLVDKTVTIPLL